jgi:beta-glucanase (GH16 family)
MSWFQAHRQIYALVAALLVVGAAVVASDSPGYAGRNAAISVRLAHPAPSSAVPTGARLVFSDDFSGGSLDAAKWITCYPWAAPSGCTNTSTLEREWYVPWGVSVSNGALHLTARREQVIGQRKRYDFTSGMVATAGVFDFTYGHVEFRARVPGGRGLWSALWLLPADQSWPPEVDAVEVLGDDTTSAALTYHPKHGRARQRQVRAADLSIGWHDFTLDWQPGSLRWSVDGIPGFEFTGDVPSQPMYLLADLAISGSHMPDAATPFPTSLDIDYIRVWQY